MINGIEGIENTLQIIVLLGCMICAVSRAASQRSRKWTLLALFYGCWVLDDLYWLLCLMFYGQSPILGVSADLCWYASYIFLYMLMRQEAPPESAREGKILPWLGPVFALAMAGFYMQWGDVLNNLVYGALMGLLLFSVLRRIPDEKYASSRFLCIVILIFCLLEYALWTASCFWKSDTLSNPYYWFDFLLTASFPVFLPATKRAVAA